ncbi:MAG: cereblon family protein [Pseudomonadota bacterium]
MPKQTVKPLEAICCLACGGVVTWKDQKIQVSGSHSHTFFNPAGIVYELGCFQQAPGCLVVGPPSAEFTWFPGHLWRLALCRRCRTHLGWLFAMAGATFYGLILSKLRE